MTYLDEVLDEQEQTYIQQFYENEKMREAVKKVLLAGIYENGVIKKTKKPNSLRNVAFNLVAAQGEFTDAQVASDLRALWQGVNALENAFNQLSKYKREEKGSAKGNPAI